MAQGLLTLRNLISKSASLVIADSAVPFPLPDRWTNDDKSMS